MHLVLLVHGHILVLIHDLDPDLTHGRGLDHIQGHIMGDMDGRKVNIVEEDGGGLALDLVAGGGHVHVQDLVQEDLVQGQDMEDGLQTVQEEDIDTVARVLQNIFVIGKAKMMIDINSGIN